ncbi:helix-turn-helix domain-containing protein [Flavobacterium turcicum]|uniref:Helix-turn-helix transcriptional regulator n=1 Tax=Flavobacterium turcicum TaxID=2764718 RepID=A0ABR7JF91_9FLAO|nr:helix-turn-helix transcriptional regulator [Flavobacterium turcicum]MBC5862839.1 helix-turn-helix transcriptional regulator [Flavobacterium turcicum]NHL01571.1 helix-turn-helix transcriptional regulator [Flavobacterium turcicum]
MHESLTDIEKYLIKKVKELREKKGLSQVSLSLALGKSTTFISDIEAPSKKAKYNVKHLNDISRILECSPKDFWPEQPL